MTCWNHYIIKHTVKHSQFQDYAYLEVDVSIGQSTGAALVKEVDILNKQAEERDDNLEREKREDMLELLSWVNLQ